MHRCCLLWWSSSNLMPCRCHLLAALSTRPCFAHTSFSRLGLLARIFTLKRVPVPIFSPSFFVCLSKRLCSYRRTHTLHHSHWQGHILPSRGPRHPRPALLVLQVVSSPYAIEISILLRALVSLLYSHLFLMSCLVDFYLFLFSRVAFPVLLSPYLTSSLVVCETPPPSSPLPPP